MDRVSVEMKVALFLHQLKENYDNNKCFVTRRKDEKINKLLRELGWTRMQMFEFLIDNLLPEDYVKGPEKQHGNSDGKVWVFIKMIEGKSVYIKISNLPNGSLCLSFHEDEKGRGFK